MINLIGNEELNVVFAMVDVAFAYNNKPGYQFLKKSEKN